MLELYEQNKLPQGSEIEGSGGAVHNQRGPIKASAVSDELVSSNGPIPASGGSVSSSGKPGASKHTSARSGADQVENHSASLKTGQINDDGSTEMSSVINEHKLDLETKDDLRAEFTNKDSDREVPNRTETKEDRAGDDERVDGSRGNKTADAGERKETGSIKPIVGRNLESGERPVSQSPHDALKTLDTDKWKAQAEKIRKSRLDMIRKKDVVDEDDLIERALEDGVESAVEDERMKQERRQSWSKNETHYNKDHDIHNKNGHSSRGAHIVEEGEMLDESSPMVNSRKRKGSPLDKRSENKHHREYLPGNHHRSDSSTHDDGHRAGKGGGGYGEREHGKQT